MDQSRVLQPMHPNLGKRKSNGDEDLQAKRMRAQDISTTPFDARQAMLQYQQQQFDPRFGGPQAAQQYHHQQQSGPQLGDFQTTHLHHREAAYHANPIIRYEVPQYCAQQASYPGGRDGLPMPAPGTHPSAPECLDSGAFYQSGGAFGPRRKSFPTQQFSQTVQQSIQQPSQQTTPQPAPQLVQNPVQKPGQLSTQQPAQHVVQRLLTQVKAAPSPPTLPAGSTPSAQVAGTQGNPISLDDDPIPDSQLPPPPQENVKPVEQKFYGVARGLLIGVFELHEKEDARRSTIGWATPKCKHFPSREEAADYVRQNQLEENAQYQVVQRFFDAWKFPTRAEWQRRKDLYQWFMAHPKAQSLSWRTLLIPPRPDAFFADEQKAGGVPGSQLHERSYRQEQYQLAPALSSSRRKIPPKVNDGPVSNQYRAPSHTLTATSRQAAAAGIAKQPANPEPRCTDLPSSLQQHEQVMIAEEERLQQYYAAQHADLGIAYSGAVNIQPLAEARNNQSRPEVKIEPDLCPEQQALADLILEGKNVFYTGSAGCGKSTVLKAFVRDLKAAGKEVRIVAPTGKAALEVNGTTYFTFAGWVPSHFKKPLKELRKGAHQTWVNKRMRNVDVLIIDEISMLENHIFERLNEVMKEARGSHAAFGGVQIVVTGDFCQLPPVKPFKYCLECGREMMHRHYNNSFECKTHGSFPETDKWAFKSKAWAECKFKHVNLTTIHRQRDRAFIDILERCRMGKKLTSEETNLLLNHKCKVQNPTRLYSTRAEVNRLNEAEYAKLRNKERPYKAFDDALIHPHHPNLHMKAERGPDGLIAALREGKFEPQVDLKQGMRVVLQVNLSIADGLVNGAQGVIGGWEPYSKEKLPRTEKKTGMTSRDRDPAAAMTVAPNTINGEHAQYREAKLKEFVKDRQIKEWPIVDFDNGLRRTIYAECLVYEFGDDAPYSIMSRTQLPLIAGWAMTVHKSQGMTLNQVEVDLGKAFEEGQMYVALSRATSLEGLKVKSLGTMTGGGNAEVHEFLRDKFGLKG